MTQGFSLDELIGYHLRRASNIMMADLTERLSVLCLTTTEASILVVLAAETAITQAEIGRRLSIKRANMAPIVAGLVARKLIVRGQSAGRSHPLHLSLKGKALASDVSVRMADNDAQFFASLPAEDQQKLKLSLGNLWRDRSEAS